MIRSFRRLLLPLLAAVVVAAGCGSNDSGLTSQPSASKAAVAGSSTPAPTAVGTATQSCAAPVTGTPGYLSYDCSVNAPSLAGNKVEDEPLLSVTVLVPQDSAGSAARRPVVYVLGDFGADTDALGGPFAGALPSVSATASTAIVVLVSGVNAFNGSFFVDSSVTGRWETAIAKDLVEFTDANYPTIPAAASRGIAGHGMGGYGALWIAMRHPDEFGAVYAMSPDLFDGQGADELLADKDVVAATLDLRAGLPPKATIDDLTAAVAGADPTVQFEVAYGAAFAPNASAPLLSNLPFAAGGGRDAGAWKQWEAGFGDLGAKVREYGPKLKQLRGICVDYGTADENAWITRGSRYFVGLLQDAQIPVTERTFDGGHADQLGERMADFMLPFMAQKLAPR